TLEKLCGAPHLGALPMDGRDIWPTLTAGAKSPHDVILLNTAPDVGAVRGGDWKLIVHEDEGGLKKGRGGRRADGTVELFNLKTDPYEKTNLANEQPDKVKSLRKSLAAFAKDAIPPKAEPQPKTYKAPAVWGEFGG